MEFDFRQEYSRYSNVELLRVVMLQHQYQPAAVAIAEELLAGRNVTEEEYNAAAASIAPKPRAQPKPVADDAAWQAGNEIFDASAARPPFEAVKQRWLILTVILGLLALNKSWRTLALLANPSTLTYSGIDFVFNILLLVAQVGGFILFFQRKRGGWILTLTWIVYLSITSLVSLFTLVYYHFYRQSHGLLVQEILMVVAGILLCSQRIKTYYGIDKPMLQKTLFASIGGSLLLCVATIAIVYFLNQR